MHRDFKPDNVLLTSFSKNDKTVKLCDFGLCRQASGVVSGLTNNIVRSWHHIPP